MGNNRVNYLPQFTTTALRGLRIGPDTLITDRGDLVPTAGALGGGPSLLVGVTLETAYAAFSTAAAGVIAGPRQRFAYLLSYPLSQVPLALRLSAAMNVTAAGGVGSTGRWNVNVVVVLDPTAAVPTEVQIGNFVSQVVALDAVAQTVLTGEIQAFPIRDYPAGAMIAVDIIPEVVAAAAGAATVALRHNDAGNPDTLLVELMT